MADEKIRVTDLPGTDELRNDGVFLVNQAGVDYKLPATKVLRTDNNLADVDPAQGRNNLNTYSKDETDLRTKLAAKAVPAESITDGLAKTSAGELFVVPQGKDSESSFIYYRNNGSGAIEIAQDAGIGAINAVKARIPINYEDSFIIMADNGPIAIIDQNGTLQVLGLSAETIQANTFQIAVMLSTNIVVLDPKTALPAGSVRADYWPFSVKDNNDKYVMLLDNDSTLHTVQLESGIITIGGKDITTMFEPVTVKPKYPVEPNGVLDGYEHIPYYGQSQVIGTTNGVIHNYDFDPKSFMLNGGLRAFNVDGHDPNIAEDVYYTGLKTVRDRNGETFIPGQDLAYRKFLTVEHPDRDVKPVFTLGGQGGSTVVMINKGTTAYNELIKQWVGAINSIKAAGGTYRNDAMVYAQGGSDDGIATPPQTWEDQVTQLRKDINADVLAQTGVKVDPAYIFPQINNYMRYPALNGKPNIGLRQYDLAINRDGWFGSAPTYINDFIDVAHWTKESQIKVGAYIDRVYRNIITEGGTWKPLHPIKFTVPGDGSVTIKFHLPSGGKLVIDDGTIVNTVAAAGFAGVDGSGATVTPASCTVVGTDTVRLVFTGGTANIKQITYAQTGQIGDPNATDGSGLGRVNGMRGNLRDNAGDSDTIDINGAAYPLHNWCWMFTHNL